MPSPRSRLQSPVVLASAAAVIVVALIVAAVLSKPRPVDAPPPAPNQPTAAPQPVPCRLDTVVTALSVRQKLAQLLMVGVKNLADAEAVVRQQEVGGIFITSWTAYSMLGAPLTALAPEPRPLPIAVSVDEEGGRVQRLKGLIGSQPSARELVAAGKTPEQVREIARLRGLAMKELGITIDFAPVVDITAAADGTPIRSVVGDDPVEFAEDFVRNYAEGQRMNKERARLTGAIARAEQEEPR